MKRTECQLHRRSFNETGHAHELTFSCYRRYRFLIADRTCNWLCEAFETARREFDFDIWAYVFMPEHVHVIIRPRQKSYEIEEILAAIKEPVARKAVSYLTRHSPEWIPKITVKTGKKVRRRFWQKGGGYDRNVVKPGTLLSMSDYIHENPIRRQLVKRAIEWKWSSAAWYLGHSDVPLRIDPIPPEWLPEWLAD